MVVRGGSFRDDPPIPHPKTHHAKRHQIQTTCPAHLQWADNRGGHSYTAISTEHPQRSGKRDLVRAIAGETAYGRGRSADLSGGCVAVSAIMAATS